MSSLERAQAATEAEIRAEAEKQGLGQAFMGDLGEILQSGSQNLAPRIVGAAFGRLASAIADAMGPAGLRQRQAAAQQARQQAAPQQQYQRTAANPGMGGAGPGPAPGPGARRPNPWVGPPPGFRPGGGAATQPPPGWASPPPFVGPGQAPPNGQPPPPRPQPQQEQWRAPPPPPPPPQTGPRRSINPEVVTLLRKMSLPPTASWDDVERRYKDLARMLHPDAGGDGKAMSDLNTTKNRLKELMK